MDTVINVDHVSKRFRLYYDRPLSLKERMVRGAKGAYRDFYALKDVSFQIERGGTVGLIGKNGSGKSTLLKLINRTMFPDKGKIHVTGKVASLIELGAGFHPELSGRENIYTNASVFGFRKDEIKERIPDIIRFSELEEFIDNPVRTYSSGMYARLGFSVAIHVDPDILLVDEILGVGDMNFQRKCADRIYEMRKKGVTLIIVSHDMNMMDRLCDYAIWLDQGEKVDEGNAKQIHNRYIEFMAKEQEAQLKAESTTTNDAQSRDDQEPSSGTGDDDHCDTLEETEGLGHHFGTGDVIFTAVKVLDANGTDKRSFRSDEELRLVVDYMCRVPPEKLSVNIGMEIHAMDGTLITGTNTARDGIRDLRLKNEGSFEVVFQALHLVEGTYYLGVAISNEEETVHYDYYHEIAMITLYAQFRGIGLIETAYRFHLDGKTIEARC